MFFFPYKIETDEYDYPGIPFLVYIIMAGCIGGHIIIFKFLSEFQMVDIFYQFGCVPAEFRWWTTITCTFLHGSWMHLIGNMYFLWIYGPLCEKSMGKLCFLLLYVLGAIASATGHVLTTSSFYYDIPCIGASGAISAVLGAFLVTFPNIRIRFVTFIIFYPRPLPSTGPAWFILGFWFIMQIFSSLNLAGTGTVEVAYWAHIIGFAVGAGLGSLYLYLENRHESRRIKQGLKLLNEGIDLDGEYLNMLDEVGLIDASLMRALNTTDYTLAYDRIYDEWQKARTAGDDGKAVLCYYRLLSLYGPERIRGDMHAWTFQAASRLKRTAIAQYACYQAFRNNDGTLPAHDKLLNNLRTLYRKVAKDPLKAAKVHNFIGKFYPNSKFARGSGS